MKRTVHFFKVIGNLTIFRKPIAALWVALVSLFCVHASFGQAVILVHDSSTNDHGDLSGILPIKGRRREKAFELLKASSDGRSWKAQHTFGLHRRPEGCWIIVETA